MKFFKIIAILLIIVLLIMLLSTVFTKGFTGIKDIFNKIPTDEFPSGLGESGTGNDNANKINDVVNYEMPSNLYLSDKAFEMAKENGSSYLEYYLTATVYPEDATNKAVDWTVSWADGSSSQDVKEFMSVAPMSDGSCTAVVICYKAFDKDINITVTTRENHFTKTCVAKCGILELSLDVTYYDNRIDSEGCYRIGSQLANECEFSIVDNLGQEHVIVGAEYEYSILSESNPNIQMVSYVGWSSSDTFLTSTYGWSSSSVDLLRLFNTFHKPSIKNNVLSFAGLDGITSSYKTGVISGNHSDSGKMYSTSALTKRIVNNLYATAVENSLAVDWYEQRYSEAEANEALLKTPISIEVTEKITGLTKIIKVRCY